MKETECNEVMVPQELKVKFGRLVSIRIKHLHQTDRVFRRKIDAIFEKDIPEMEQREQCVELAVTSFKRMPPREEESELYEEVKRMYQNL